VEKISVEYNKLRSTYVDVLAFTKDYAFWKKTFSASTTIEEDLELYGDDNIFFLLEFEKKFGVDLRNFKYDAHFEPEGYIDPLSLILLPGLLSFEVLKGILIIISMPFSSTIVDQIKALSLVSSKNSKLKDVTIGDLVVSVLKGKFCERNDTTLLLA